MSYSLIAHTGAGGSANSATTSAINTSGANLLIVSASWYAGTTTSGVVSDSKSNTWTLLTKHTSDLPCANQLFYCVPVAVGSGHTFTFSGTDSFASIGVQAWSGNAAVPFDSQSGNDQTHNISNTIQPGSLLPSEDNCLVVASLQFENNSANTVTIDSGFTISDTVPYSGGNNEGGSMAYLVQTTATSVNPTWDVGGNMPWLATTLAVFKAASGGGGFLPAWGVRANHLISGGGAA